MTNRLRLFGLPREWALILLPLLAIAAGRLAARTPLALAYPRTAALLLLWLVADALMLSFMARAAPATPRRRAALAVLAGAMVAAAIVMPAPLRAALFTMPMVAALMAAVIAAHLGWGAARARSAYAAATGARGERCAAALAECVPPALARFVVAEIRLLRLALLQWRSPPDVPAGSIAFAYHRHLVPIFAVLLTLQLLELGVVHLLVALWSPRAALFLSLLSFVAFVYLVGLLKSFRIRPVLLAPDGLRVRTGILADRSIPIDAIASVRTAFGAEEVKRPGTCDAALLAWPNILIGFNRPLADPHFLRPGRMIDAIAFRVDDATSFEKLLRSRLEHAPPGGTG